LVDWDHGTVSNFRQTKRGSAVADEPRDALRHLQRVVNKADTQCDKLVQRRNMLTTPVMVDVQWQKQEIS